MRDQSPTDPASVDDCRRRDDRFDAQYSVLLGNNDATTRNISVSGIYFETEQQVVVGSSIRFAVMLPPDQANPDAKPLWCCGKVVRVDSLGSGRVGVGVAFESSHAHG